MHCVPLYNCQCVWYSRELSDKINSGAADLKVVEKKLPPMESKLSECALKTELKMQVMLLRGQVEEITAAVPVRIVLSRRRKEELLASSVNCCCCRPIILS